MELSNEQLTSFVRNSWRKTPGLFASRISQRRWKLARHLEYLDRLATDHVTGRTASTILIVELPVRHGKTEYCGHYLPAWFLLSHPDRHVILASSTDRLAQRSGRRVRSTFAEWAPEFNTAISTVRRSQHDWETAAAGGMLTCGVGGDLVGRGAGLLIVDDYLRNSEDALSETIRDKQWDWFQSTFFTRLEPGGKMVMLATRWHEDDLIGRVVADYQGMYTRITLPALALTGDPLGRGPGEALWPQRWPVGNEDGETINDDGQSVVGLAMRRRITEPHWWDAVYQQNPTGHGIRQWPESYFANVLCDRLPLRSDADVVAVDTAEGKDKKKGCYSAIVAAKVSDGKIWCSALIEREPPEITIQRAVGHAVACGCRLLIIEAQSFETLVSGTIERELRRQGGHRIRVEIVRNIVPKLQRIQRLGEYLHNDQLRVVGGAGGSLLVGQLREFPHGFLDGPDALEMAVRYLPDSLRPRVGVGSSLVRA